ncbi:hypothetical protein RUM43_001377 [Polyplax serrata]|uniref:Uncharacterized protein n=1 Tax=Polyplax serrata TaxID=468196 RepID=A0AAN8XS04_POLSC
MRDDGIFNVITPFQDTQIYIEKCSEPVKYFYYRQDDSNRDNKPIDLEKLFTPATDSGDVTPSKNSKCLCIPTNPTHRCSDT